MVTSEVYKSARVPGYEGIIAISNKGHVKRLKTGKVVSLKQDKLDGYVRVSLSKDGNHKNALVHRLVAQAFLRKPSKSTRTEVDHIDGNRSHNAASNLRYVDSSENKRNIPKQAGGTSQYLGVAYVSANGKWRAQASVGDVNHHIGYFATERAAAKARDAWVRKKGLGWKLNFP